MSEGLQGRLEPCHSCPLSYLCREEDTDVGCQSQFTLLQEGRLSSHDVMHPLRPDLTERLCECGGPDIRIRTRAGQQPLPTLPRYIPRVQVQAGLETPQCPAVAVPLDRVGTSGRVRPADEIKTDLRLPAEAVVIVSSFQKDCVLERAWHHRRALVQSFATAGYDLVTVPNFSLWEGDPPLEHRYNIARSLRMFEALVGAGVPTIPHVSWYLLRRDLAEWVKELRHWPDLRAFSLDLQTLKAEEAWARAVRELRHLFDGIGQDWDVLVNGVAQRRRIREVREICGRMHLMNERPFQLAIHGRMSVDDLSTGRTRSTDKAPTEIFAIEVQKMRDCMA